MNTVSPGPAACAPSEDLLEVQVLGPHQGSAEWKLPASWVLTNILGNSEAHSGLRTPDLGMVPGTLSHLLHLLSPLGGGETRAPRGGVAHGSHAEPEVKLLACPPTRCLPWGFQEPGTHSLHDQHGEPSTQDPESRLEGSGESRAWKLLEAGQNP